MNLSSLSYPQFELDSSTQITQKKYKENSINTYLSDENFC